MNLLPIFLGTQLLIPFECSCKIVRILISALQGNVLNGQMGGIENGIISPERLDDALHRILGLKAKLQLYKPEMKIPAPEMKDRYVGCEEHLEFARQAADQCVTLVKDTQHNLPIDPKVKKRARLIFIQSTPTTKAYEGNPVKQVVIEELERAGFTVDAAPSFHDLEVVKGPSPENLMTMMNCGKMEEFASRYDVAFLVINVKGYAQENCVRLRWSCNHSSELPWYATEVPTIGISLNYTTPKSYIADVALVSEVSDGTGQIDYKVETVGEGQVKVEIYDQDGVLAAEAGGAEGRLAIPDVHLWQPLHAYLYEVKVTFGEDIYTLPYGVRTVKVEGGKFLINGEPFYFKGYGKHEDTYPAGRGLNLPMNTKDISLMKWQGANSFRTSHYPYSEEMMRLCDQEGIVVIDETPAVGVHLNFGGGANFKNGKRINTFDPIEEGGIRTLEHHKDVVRDMIDRDKNHACVVMWSIANESDSGSEGAYEYFKPLYDIARAEDPQHRPCTIVSVQMANYQEDCTIKLSDVVLPEPLLRLVCLRRRPGCSRDTAQKRTGILEQSWKTVYVHRVRRRYGMRTA